MWWALLEREGFHQPFPEPGATVLMQSFILTFFSFAPAYFCLLWLTCQLSHIFLYQLISLLLTILEVRTCRLLKDLSQGCVTISSSQFLCQPLSLRLMFVFHIHLVLELGWFPSGVSSASCYRDVAVSKINNSSVPPPVSSLSGALFLTAPSLETLCLFCLSLCFSNDLLILVKKAPHHKRRPNCDKSSKW